MSGKTIDSLVQEIPLLINTDSPNLVEDSIEEARRRYDATQNPTEFAKAEIEGDYGPLRHGIQMVYLIGRGYSYYDGKPTESIFYLENYGIRHFLEGTKKDSRDIKSIRQENVSAIKFLKISE